MSDFDDFVRRRIDRAPGEMDSFRSAGEAVREDGGRLWHACFDSDPKRRQQAVRSRAAEMRQSVAHLDETITALLARVDAEAQP